MLYSSGGAVSHSAEMQARQLVAPGAAASAQRSGHMSFVFADVHALRRGRHRGRGYA